MQITDDDPDRSGRGYRHRLYQIYGQEQLVDPPRDPARAFESRRPYLERLIRDWFPPDRDARILDLGCGQGALIHFARLAGYRDVRGIDASPKSVRTARDLIIQGVDHGLVLEVLPRLAAASVDCVVTLDLVEHLTKDELLLVADQVRRVLSTGGRWIIHTVNGSCPWSGQVRYGDLTHEQAFTVRSLEQLFDATGFTSAVFREDRPVRHSVISTFRWAAWQIIRVGLVLVVAVESGHLDFRAVFSPNFLAVAFVRALVRSR